MTSLRAPSPRRWPLAIALSLALAFVSSAPSSGQTGGLLAPVGGLITGIVRLLGNPLHLLNVIGQPVSAQATIDGAVGGTVTAGRWTVVVPPGAWSGVGQVSVSVPNSAVLACDLSITPASLNAFRAPVVLTCDAHGVDAPNPAALTLGWFYPTIGQWVQVSGAHEDGGTVTITAPLMHFSKYGIFTSRAGW